MADQRITALGALGAAPAAGDLIEVVDISDTSMAATGTNKKMTVTELFTTPIFTTDITTPIVKSGAGSALALRATAPAAAGGASQVGVAATLGASNAVASTDTAGAAAGGAITITSGNAARNTSGNANGGDVTVALGSGIGTGVAGKLLISGNDGAATIPSIASATAGTAGIGFAGNGTAVDLIAASVGQMRVQNNAVKLQSGSVLGWTTSGITTGNTTGFSRIADGLVALGTGLFGSTGGWMQWAGEAYLAADGTNATATLATTGLSVNVTTGRKYGFRCILYVSDSVAAEGVQIDFAGGSATETNFRAQATGFDSALAISTQLDDLADVASAATFTGAGIIEINGTFEPGSTGTFIPRFAQASHVTGTLTIFRGSHLLMWDMP